MVISNHQQGNEARLPGEGKMNKAFAQNLANMANAAEAAILSQATNEIRDWYFSLSRETRVQIAIDAAAKVLQKKV